MNLWGRLRRRKREDGSLAKYLYLTDSEVAYRLITSPDRSEPTLDLADFYAQLCLLKENKGQAVRYYLIVFFAALLSRFDLISAISPVGVDLLPSALGHVLLPAFSLSALWMSVSQIRERYIANIFNTVFYQSTAPVRARLLARYPQAFDFLKYYLAQIGTLPYTASMRLPIRMMIFLPLIVLGLLGYLAISAWLVIGLSIEVWQSTSPIPEFWSHMIVVVSTIGIVTSWLLPFDLLLKRSYMHIGFDVMMNRAHNSNKTRYIRFLNWADRSKHS